MKDIRIGTLICSVFVPLLVGALSAALSSRQMANYGNMNKPPLSPPAWVFSVVWTILYLMMGLASYYVFVSTASTRNKVLALVVYSIQLVMNFMWSIIFFNWETYFFAFIWLLIMWSIVILCAVMFWGLSKVAAFLLIPYIFWLTFAAYLNFGAFWLNLRKI